MSRIVKNFTGHRFGRLTAMSESGRHKNGRVLWECLCDCGNTVNIASNNLHGGNSKSCGCLKKESSTERGKKLLTTHGLSKTPEYGAWKNIIQRCNNPNDQSYSNYGERGIKICDRWLNSFENFYTDLGPRPTDAHSVDRINNNGHYEPGNCKWSTMDEQSNNKRNNHIVTYRDKEYTLANLAKEHNLKDSIVRDRLRLGWTIENTIETPFNYRSSQ